MTRRKILCWAAEVVAVVLAVTAVKYPTWLTDYSFPWWGDSMTWFLIWPLVCLLLTPTLVIVGIVCYPGEPEPGEPKTEVLERTPAPN
jgi:hypothetical protein